jgi:hypothetical protein
MDFWSKIDLNELNFKQNQKLNLMDLLLETTPWLGLGSWYRNKLLRLEDGMAVIFKVTWVIHYCVNIP